MENVKILGIAGSLRQASFNRAARRAAQGLVPDGVTLDTAEIGGLPLFSQDIENPLPPPVAVLKKDETAKKLIRLLLQNLADWTRRLAQGRP